MLENTSRLCSFVRLKMIIVRLILISNFDDLFVGKTDKIDHGSISV